MRFLSDYRHLISALTFGRIINLLKLTSSYYLSLLMRRAIHWGNPYSISVEPSTFCNLSCPECPSGLRQFRRPTGRMLKEMYYTILEEVSDDLIYLILYFQGEPYTNNHILDFVRMAKQRKIYVTTSTNGHYLDDDNARKTVLSKLDRIIISLDGTDAATYQQYRRNGDFDTVIAGIKNLVRWKKELKSSTPFISLQFLVLKTNEHQIKEIKKLGKSLGVDSVDLKTAQFYHPNDRDVPIPSNKKYSRYRLLENGNYVLNNKFPNHCYRMWSTCVITWNGWVVPCCFDKNADHNYGDINELPFSEIWNSDETNKFRNAIFTKRTCFEICRNCTEGLRR